MRQLDAYIYDLETFKDIFLFLGSFVDQNEMQVFEISRRVNQRDQLLQHLSYLQNRKALMVGYNNIPFDYPILHELLNQPYTFDQMAAYLKAQQLITSQRDNFNQIRMGDRLLPQIDLLKINHFDNVMKRTSLKALQFAMRLPSVEDLPFDPASDLTFEQMDLIRLYGGNDIFATKSFYQKCKHVIDIRMDLLENGVLQGDVLNWSDVKLGTEYLIKKIGRAKCFVKGSTPRQTFRESIAFKDIILKKIAFRTEKFQEVLNWFNQQTIWIQKEDERPKLEVELAGLQFVFGVGGVHASVEDKYFESNDDYCIRDIDVSGMYVAVALAAGFFPEHLGTEFVNAYKHLQSDRKLYPKGSSMNLILKLAGNGVYGNSNNSYSCFYDPKYTFSVTVNGQLQLLMLAETLSMIPGIQLIQANTDGITAYVPRKIAYLFDLWKSDWECITGLKLEEVPYKKMWIRDVNNYVALTESGEIKRKGAYWYPIKPEDYWGGSGSNWNKDFSNTTAQKGIEQVFLTGCTPEQVVYCITDPFDFMMRYKTNAGAKVFIGDKEMTKTVRYYVSTKGEKMLKVSKPKGEIGAWKRRSGLTDSEFNKILKTVPEGAWDERIHTKNKSKYVEVRTSIESGRLVKCCNNAKDFDWSDVDYSYYIEEIKKLMIGVSNGNVQPT